VNAAPPQRTITRAVEVSGIGIHTGAPSSARLLPAPADQGVVFARTDVAGAPLIPARLSEVVSTERSVVLGRQARVATVEHLLAAAAGLGIDNLTVEVAGEELPCGDGSGLLFTDALVRAGTIAQDAPRRPIALSAPVWVQRERSLAVAIPAPSLHVTAAVTADGVPMPAQVAEFDARSDDFAAAIAPARTWGLATEAEAMRARGLARGASLATALVIGPNGYLNEPRFPDELARHKILDVLGDLALLGRPLCAWVVAIRAGHSLHVRLAEAIAASAGTGR
jgi:UDP-3-O-[3-hydroxymyristoyl] N-acetylglucosamine deacetylase